MVDFANNPQLLNIKAGDTVIWVNDGFSNHDATSGVDPTSDGAWGSPVIPPGGSWSRKFNAQDKYQYFCALHPGLMPGTIVVEG
jgi:plastocyanin